MGASLKCKLSGSSEHASRSAANTATTLARGNARGRLPKAARKRETTERPGGMKVACREAAQRAQPQGCGAATGSERVRVPCYIASVPATLCVRCSAGASDGSPPTHSTFPGWHKALARWCCSRPTLLGRGRGFAAILFAFATFADAPPPTCMEPKTHLS